MGATEGESERFDREFLETERGWLRAVASAEDSRSVRAKIHREARESARQFPSFARHIESRRDDDLAYLLERRGDLARAAIARRRLLKERMRCPQSRLIQYEHIGWLLRTSGRVERAREIYAQGLRFAVRHHGPLSRLSGEDGTWLRSTYIDLLHNLARGGELVPTSVRRRAYRLGLGRRPDPRDTTDPASFGAAVHRAWEAERARRTAR